MPSELSPLRRQTRLVEIREGSAEDLELLVRLRLEFLVERTATPRDEVVGTLEAPTREYLGQRFAAGDLWTWFAEDADGTAVGVVTLVLAHIPPRPGELRALQAHVLNMFVRPEHRSTGLGRRLLTAAIEAAEARGVRALVLHATDDGRPLYASLGFAPHPDWMERPVPPR
jgi:GNAT superfamily N-acetyltransferase